MSGHTPWSDIAHKADQHTHDAWIIGTHDLPEDYGVHLPEYVKGNLRDGNVVIHNIRDDHWSVMSPAMFNRWYEWCDDGAVTPLRIVSTEEV